MQLQSLQQIGNNQYCVVILIFIVVIIVIIIVLIDYDHDIEKTDFFKFFLKFFSFVFRDLLCLMLIDALQKAAMLLVSFCQHFPLLQQLSLSPPCKTALHQKNKF